MIGTGNKLNVLFMRGNTPPQSDPYCGRGWEGGVIWGKNLGYWSTIWSNTDIRTLAQDVPTVSYKILFAYLKI